jgi:multisubunit Na+/H+ antiporter MnhE subunit
MKGNVSLPGLLLGTLTALAVWLLVSHYSLAWLVIGVGVGMAMGAVMARASRADQGTPLRKGEQQ